MKTAIFLLQSQEQTEPLRSLIQEAMGRGYKQFITAIKLTEEKGLVFSIDCSLITDFPDNLFKADGIAIVKEPLVWLCERGEIVLAVWDGEEDIIFKQLAFIKAWGLTGVYFHAKYHTLESL